MQDLFICGKHLFILFFLRTALDQTTELKGTSDSSIKVNLFIKMFTSFFVGRTSIARNHVYLTDFHMHFIEFFV